MFTHSMALIVASKVPLAVPVVEEELRILADADPIAPNVLERIQKMRQTVCESEDIGKNTSFLSKNANQLLRVSKYCRLILVQITLGCIKSS
jgi:hypothetical protein